MAKRSAGLLMFRRTPRLEVLLAHPGGPFFAKRDEGVWTIPKGEPDPGEDLLEAARREFTEETGFTAEGPFTPLAPVVQKSGKVVHAWACEGDVDPSKARSNTVPVEWPPRSGRTIEVPEVDRVAWFAPHEAKHRANPAQVALVVELVSKLG